MKLTFFIAALLLAGVVVVLGLVKLTDTRQEVFFPDYPATTEFRSKGWLPGVLTDSARNIYMYYDLDSNRGFGTCTMSRDDIVELLAQLRQVSPEELKGTASQAAKVLRRRPSWWPGDIEKQLQTQMLWLAGDKTHLYAIKDNRIYFWLNFEPNPV